MRIQHKISALTLGLIASAFAVGAQAQSVDLRVTGTITPAACVPTLTGGGVIDFGSIAANTLNVTAPTQLADKTTSLTITCDAPAQVGFKLIDNRAGTAVGAQPGMESFHFGLGQAGAANIGGFMLTFADMTMDGATGTALYGTPEDAWWDTMEPNLSPIMTFEQDGYVYSGSKTGARAPDAFQTMTSTLNVQTVINRADALPLSGEITLDGSATIELVYL